MKKKPIVEQLSQRISLGRKSTDEKKPTVQQPSRRIPLGRKMAELKKSGRNRKSQHTTRCIKHSCFGFPKGSRLFAESAKSLIWQFILKLLRSKSKIWLIAELKIIVNLYATFHPRNVSGNY